MSDVSLVSILVPAHNAARTIVATLESALAQTHARCEIIVVDDGSQDHTLSIAERFRPRGVTVVSQANRGASAARNHALTLAHGAFVQYLDADDLIAPDKIVRQLDRLRTSEPRIVASCEWARFTDEAPSGPLEPQEIWRDLSAPDFLVACAMHELMFPPIAWLIPRVVCDDAGGWDESLSLNDDGEYMSRVLAASDGIVFTPGAKAYYRSGNPGSYASQRSHKAAASELRAWDQVVATLLRLEDSPRTRAAAAAGYQRIQAAWLGRCDEVVDRAAQQERGFGGGRYRFDGGVVFRSVARLAGWRSAVRLRRLKEAVQVKARG